MIDPLELKAGAPPAAFDERPETSSDWPARLYALAATAIAVGIIWDISWHTTIGRDAFWTPAHVTIYFGGVLGGCVGGWLAIQNTFFASARRRAATVSIFGARAPLGAWVAIWGAVAMLTSAPFDNWWHNAYGLDVKIISPPHSLLGLGMFGISFGALLLVLSRQNRARDGVGGGLFIYVGGIFLLLGGVFVMEYSFPNLQHGALFYRVAAISYPIRLVTIGRAGRVSWPATRAAAVFVLADCLMIWILPLFPAHPKLAPIFNPLTHMVPPPFPVLLFLPAIGIDLVLAKYGDAGGWKQPCVALAVSFVFLAIFIPVQWYFSRFLISPAADNWFFAGNRIWSFASSPGEWHMQFWHVRVDHLTFRAVGMSWLIGGASAWLGLRLGGWMRKVQR